MKFRSYFCVQSKQYNYKVLVDAVGQRTQRSAMNKQWPRGNLGTKERISGVVRQEFMSIWVT